MTDGRVPSIPEIFTVPTRMVTYPFTVRHGVVAELRLPVDLTQAEAERLGRFVISLVIYPEAPARG